MSRRYGLVLAAVITLAVAAPRYAMAQSYGADGSMLSQTIFGEAARATQQPHAKSPTETVSDVKKHMDDVDPRVRVAALGQLELVNTPDANAILMRGMTDPDMRVKIKAIDILGAHQFTDAVVPMSQYLFLRDTPPVVRLHLVAALGRIGDQRGVLPVMQYLGEAHDDQSRGTAVFALGEMGSPKASDTLTNIIATDKSPMVRRLAQEALAKIDGELPSVHSEQVAAEHNKEMVPTYERLMKLRQIDEKLQEQQW
jgi:HEAT repeat protein